ncbi:hypothetical protein [Providencia sp. PROV099]|uniref:hypothetical protein n=1 Tax=Providencia sp. PROV099 TaxID=2949815 RepID=UPI00234B22EA|nr:hypothetical protein [Providencia sp. PROV099]WOB97429.1 hypothetical protein P3L54_22370 [Providencia sp. PROV099]
MSYQTVAIPPALGLQPPSGADVVLLAELTQALVDAKVEMKVMLEPINWTPPSGRPVMYRQDAIDVLFKAGVPVDAGEVVSATSNAVQPIDDAELEALLDMRDEMAGTDSFLQSAGWRAGWHSGSPVCR